MTTSSIERGALAMTNVGRSAPGYEAYAARFRDELTGIIPDLIFSDDGDLADPETAEAISDLPGERAGIKVTMTDGTAVYLLISAGPDQ